MKKRASRGEISGGSVAPVIEGVRASSRATGLLASLGLHGLAHLDAPVLAALASETPMLLIGPHGSAKSALLERLAAALRLEHRHYNASLISQYGAGNVPLAPGTVQKAAAHDAAAVVVVDHCDVLFTAGYLKAKFGTSPGSNPRQYILDALASGRIGDRSFHSDNVNYRRDVVQRIKNIAYLVATSPQALVLK